MLAGVAMGICGQMRVPIEEDLLDAALVVSGQVVYPDQAVMGLYYKGVWTLLNQLGALILEAGVHYSDANFPFLVMPPAILTGALAMFVHGLTGRPLLALAVATIGFMDDRFAWFFASPDYPLLGAAWNTPEASSYGRFGALLAAFSFAALVGGRHALAAFTAVGLVAVHPVIGAYTATMVVFGFGFARIAWSRPISRPVVLALAAGTSVTLLSLATFLLTRPNMPEVDEAMNRAYLEIYSSLWDDHRNHPATRRDIYRLAFAFCFFAAPLMAFLAVRRRRRAFADTGAVVLLAAIATSTVLYIMLHWARAFLPDIVIRGSPGRLLNIQAYLAMPLAIGISIFAFDEIACWLERRRLKRDDIQSNRAVGPALAPPCCGSRADSPPPRRLCQSKSHHAVASATGAPADHWHVGAILFRYPNAIVAAIVVALALGFVPTFAYDVATTRHEPSEIDSPFWAKARSQKINRLVLAPAALSEQALRYGRLPILLDPNAIDFLPYLPQLATAVGRIIERGYGVPFFDPPADLKFSGALSQTTGREYWACLSAGQWRRIAQEFGVGALLVPADWKVRLPLLLSDSKYAFYEMPADRPAEAAQTDIPAASSCLVVDEL